jgi:hypothetical protein
MAELPTTTTYYHDQGGSTAELQNYYLPNPPSRGLVVVVAVGAGQPSRRSNALTAASRAHKMVKLATGKLSKVANGSASAHSRPFKAPVRLSEPRNSPEGLQMPAARESRRFRDFRGDVRGAGRCSAVDRAHPAPAPMFNELSPEGETTP